MIRRFVKSFRVVQLIVVLLLLSFQPVYPQNATTGIQGGLLCPENEFVTPVLVTGLQNIDSISLLLDFPANMLTYQGYKNPDAQLSTGFTTISFTDTSVRIVWHAGAPIHG